MKTATDLYNEAKARAREIDAKEALKLLLDKRALEERARGLERFLEARRGAGERYAEILLGNRNMP